jgi:hypothetical protein
LTRQRFEFNRQRAEFDQGRHAVSCEDSLPPIDDVMQGRCRRQACHDHVGRFSHGAGRTLFEDSAAALDQLCTLPPLRAYDVESRVQ